MINFIEYPLIVLINRNLLVNKNTCGLS